MKSSDKENLQGSYVKILLYPLPLRIFHWTLVVGLSLAVATGLFKSFHIDFFTMGTGRYLHIVSGLIALAAVLYRVGYAIITGDYRYYIPRIKDFKTFPAFFKYYMFLEKTPPPPLPKYNIGQKITILSWMVSVVYLSGVGLLAYNNYYVDKFPYLKLQRLILPQRLIMSKFYLSIYVAMTIMLHIYLAHTEDIAKSQSIFTGWVRARIKDIKKN